MLLITYHVSNLNITTVFPLTSPILIPFSCHMKLRDNLNSPIVKFVTFCFPFNLYANSHNTTKLNYMATSKIIIEVVT